MENKINIAELLKDCPKGMELDCMLYNNVTLECVEVGNIEYPIEINIQSGEDTIELTEYGCWDYSDNAKCIIFPKGKTTWEGFVPPCKFKAGDVLVSEAGNIVLFSHIDSENAVHYHCIITTYRGFRIEENTSIGVGKYSDCILANEHQKQRMYDKIKSAGYKYNRDTNKLEKMIELEFKDGDVIYVKTDNNEWVSG